MLFSMVASVCEKSGSLEQEQEASLTHRLRYRVISDTYIHSCSGIQSTYIQTLYAGSKHDAAAKAEAPLARSPNPYSTIYICTCVHL